MPQVCSRGPRQQAPPAPASSWRQTRIARVVFPRKPPLVPAPRPRPHGLPIKRWHESDLGCSPGKCVFTVVLTTVCGPECVTDVHSRGKWGLPPPQSGPTGPQAGRQAVGGGARTCRAAALSESAEVSPTRRTRLLAPHLLPEMHVRGAPQVRGSQGCPGGAQARAVRSACACECCTRLHTSACVNPHAYVRV